MHLRSHLRTLGRSLREPPVAANVALRVILVVAIAYMFLFPDQPQFEGKSMTLRAVFYPLFALVVPALYVWRRMSGPYPTLADLSGNFIFTFDIVGNDLGLYTRYHAFQFVVHFVNSIPFILVLMAVLLAFERLGALRLGWRATVIFALALHTALHAGWEGFEHVMDRWFGADLQPGGMNEAFEDSVWALAGALVGLGLARRWREGFDRHFVDPVASYLGELDRARDERTSSRVPSRPRNS
jgi:hypothetical protein